MALCIDNLSNYFDIIKERNTLPITSDYITYAYRELRDLTREENADITTCNNLRDTVINTMEAKQTKKIIEVTSLLMGIMKELNFQKKFEYKMQK